MTTIKEIIDKQLKIWIEENQPIIQFRRGWDSSDVFYYFKEFAEACINEDRKQKQKEVNEAIRKYEVPYMLISDLNKIFTGE